MLFRDLDRVRLHLAVAGKPLALAQADELAQLIETMVGLYCGFRRSSQHLGQCL
jgi:hypothetical protein